jgi:hypothetical protein
MLRLQAPQHLLAALGFFALDLIGLAQLQAR